LKYEQFNLPAQPTTTIKKGVKVFFDKKEGVKVLNENIRILTWKTM